MQKWRDVSYSSWLHTSCAYFPWYFRHSADGGQRTQVILTYLPLTKRATGLDLHSEAQTATKDLGKLGRLDYETLTLFAKVVALEVEPNRP